jgi:outer membrane protein assembly factor BamA
MRNGWTSLRVGARRAAKRLLAMGLVLGLGALCAGILPLASFAASPIDDTIVVRGNRRIEAAVVRGYFHGPDGGLDAAAVNDGLKALYASGLFADVKVAWSGTHLVVTVAEAPLIDRVQFEGNKQFKDKDLTTEIRSKAHTPLTTAGVQDDVSRIAELYDATITPKTIVKGDGRVDLVFEIKEGPKTGISKIVFIGNHAFSDQRLKGVIKTSESGLLAFLKTTTPTGSNPIVTSSTPSISSTASPTPRWWRRPGPTMPRAKASTSPSRSTRASATGSAQSTSNRMSARSTSRRCATR